MRRFRKSPSYLRAEKKLVPRSIPEALLEKAWRHATEEPGIASLKFQPIAGKTGLWKFRVDLRWHIVLREEEDELGSYFVAVGIFHHDDYKR